MTLGMESYPFIEYIVEDKDLETVAYATFYEV